MNVLEQKLSKLPENVRKALLINIRALEMADFESDEVDDYIMYLTSRIFFCGYEEKENVVTITAYAYEMGDCDFFEKNLDGIFKNVRDIFKDNGWHLQYEIQTMPKSIEECFYTMRGILSAYATYLKGEYVAAQAQKQIEEKNSVGIDSLLKKKHYAQNNLLTKSGFSDSLTVVQKKLLNYFIFKFQNQKNRQEVLFGDSSFTVTPFELVRCGCGSNQTAIMKSLKELMESTSMYIQFDDRWTMYNVFSSIQGTVNENSYITVRFTPEMTALINKVGVSSNYTMLSLKSINSIKRYATMRLYELCCQYRNMDASYVTITDEQLRMMLNCNDKYQNPKEFKRCVLQVAEKELKLLADDGKVDLYFSFSETKKEKTEWDFRSKRVLEWSFVIHKGVAYEDGYIPHDKMQQRKEYSKKVFDEILNKCENISDLERSEYCRFMMSLKESDMFSLVQDLQMQLSFSQKEKSEAIRDVFESYGIDKN